MSFGLNNNLSDNLTTRYNVDNDYIQAFYNGIWTNVMKAGLQELNLLNYSSSDWTYNWVTNSPYTETPGYPQISKSSNNLIIKNYSNDSVRGGFVYVYAPTNSYFNVLNGQHLYFKATRSSAQWTAIGVVEENGTRHQLVYINSTTYDYDFDLSDFVDKKVRVYFYISEYPAVDTLTITELKIS